MELGECLTNTPYRELMVIARLRKIETGRLPRKDELVDRLSTALLDPGNLRRTLQGLSAEERQALDAVIAAGGCMSWLTFRRRFGDVRPYKPWRRDLPRHPWRNPSSPAERLVYLGLIFRHPRRPRPGDSVEILIPDDLLGRLPPVQPPAIAACLPGEQERERQSDIGRQGGDILQDVALLISLVHRQDIRPLHGRWLPPRYLHDLNRRLSWPEDLGGVRSELQTGRLRFLHFLAESAGLVGLVAGRLGPTTQAWSWLGATNQQRYVQLWDTWQARTESQRALWRRYRLPGAEYADSLLLLTRLLDHLAQCPIGHAFSLTAFTRTLLETDPDLWDLTPWWEQETGRDRTQEVIAGLMTGPLGWWGLVAVDNTATEPSFTITSLGDWLLSGAGDPPPDVDSSFALEDGLNIIVPPGVPPRALVRLEAMAEWLERTGDTLHYRLTPASLARALGRGMPLDGILVFLDQGAAGELTPEQRTCLEVWADETDAVRLYWATILETRTAKQMAELARHRSLRHHMRRTLSPRAAIVDEQAVESLHRILHRLGIYVQGTVPLPSVGSSGAHGLDAGAAAHLLIAGRVYTGLRRWIDLPDLLPAALLDNLTAHLDPGTVTAAYQIAADTLEALARAMDGWAPQPMPGTSLPIEEALPIIEEAIRHDRSLDIAYWTAGRGELSRRTVDPYRIEWRDNVAYLIAYCHERLDERVFRIDRIQKLDVRRSESHLRDPIR